MQLKKLFTLSAAALLGAIPLKSTAQTWQTVLDYQYSGGTAGGGGIVADVLGNIFSGGNASDAAGITRGMVLTTDTAQLANPDPSAINWYFSDDTNPDPVQYESVLWNLGLDASGNVYSIGQLTPNSTGVASWYVRKSSDRGLTWSNAGDPYQYAAGQWNDATGFAADNSGNIYVVGWGRDAGTKRTGSQVHWLVRKSPDGGGTWTLVDDVIGPNANAAAFVPGAGVFVVGPRWAGSASPWMVRRSLNGESGSWSTVDNPFPGGAARAVCSDSQGNVYVAGSQFITTTTTEIIKKRPVTTTSSHPVWVVRKSTDRGDTWETVDTFIPAASRGADAWGIGRNSAGGVVVVGRASDAQGQFHWLVRTPDTSGVWQTVDDFQLMPGKHSSASGVVTDAAGNLLVSGFGSDAAGSHWIVRRLAAP